MNLRLKRLVITLAPAIGLTTAGPAVVAQPKEVQRAPTATAPAATTSPQAALPRAVQAQDMHVRASELIGMNVRNPAGENLGEIKDLVVDPQAGKVHYAVVGFGGFLGLGEKLHAFPLESFKVATESDRSLGTTPRAEAPAVRSERATADRNPGNPLDNDRVRGDKGPIGSDRTTDRPAVAADRTLDRPGIATNRSAGDRPVAAGVARDVHLVLNADKDRLKEAPGFDRNKWPDWNDAKYRGEVDRYAGVNRGAVGKSANLHRMSKLLDTNVRDASNKKIGEIEDVVVKMQTGDVQYAVIQFDRGWFESDKLVAVPMKALKRGGDKDDGDLVLNANRAKLERAPAFSKNDWPDLNRGQYRSDVDRYLAGWADGPTARDRAAARDASQPAGSLPAAGVQPRSDSMPAPGVQPRREVTGPLPTDQRVLDRGRPDVSGGSRLSQDQVRRIQRELNQRGFSAGPVDGIYGEQTALALRDFQRKQRIEPTGRVDQQTLSALGVRSDTLDQQRMGSQRTRDSGTRNEGTMSERRADSENVRAQPGTQPGPGAAQPALGVDRGKSGMR